MIIDVNVYLSRWPFRRLPHDNPTSLVRKLSQRGVRQAWAGSFDGLLHKDISSVNSRLVADCKEHGEGLLVPVGSVNPTLPDWQEDLRRCHEVHQMHAIRLHPNYHGYTLDSEQCSQLLKEAHDRELVVQLVLSMEDPRVQHPLLQVPVVDTKPLETLVKQYPDLRLVIMNNYGAIKESRAAQLAESGQVYFEISHFENVGALEKWVTTVPHERLLFGSYFPFFNLEAALLKFQESQVGGLATSAIQYSNAQSLTAAAKN
ncbi:Amidohydrolase [Novipirellula galeiformis]|uniref:Amidohydrolase n=1 Tax=Novipirellula galeiformis TaxID=2528004 RepID=A0A5C6C3Y4_9BACT|nr:amidohydrolase family protein [Novipirellula galeiformis]TWU17499.1 Amidohydrolase [Novipirellula galeiformis]